jgi:hypothetical protein
MTTIYHLPPLWQLMCLVILLRDSQFRPHTVSHQLMGSVCLCRFWRQVATLPRLGD